MKDISTIDNKSIITILNAIKKELQTIFQDKLKEIILYGSYARNEENENSDIDIIVLVDADNEDLKFYREQICDLRVDLSLKYDVVLSLIIKSYGHFNKYLEVLPFYSTVNDEGVEVYG